MKICSKCKKNKPTIDFNKQLDRKSGLRSLCKECNYAQYRTYRYKHHERMLEKSKTYYRDNREKMVQWHRTYYAKHNKEENARVTKWRNDNLVKAKEQEAKYRHSDARKIVARNYRHKRRAQEGKGSGITNRQWNDILKMYNFRCAYCGIQGNMTIDHVIPLSKGGEHSIENIVPACVECNCRKNASLGWKPLIYKKAM